MKFSTILTAAFSAVSIVQAQQLTPASDPLSLDIVGRDLEGLYQIQERDLISVVEGLVSNINVSSILGSIDFESIAGWVDNILTTNNNVKYLDDLLNFVADTDLVPFLISYIISNNATRSIAGDVTIGLLGVAGKFDLTPVFEALKDSGLAYTLISDLIKNPHTFPFVKEVIVDLLSGSSSGSGTAAGTTAALYGTAGTTSALYGAAGTTSALFAVTGTTALTFAAGTTGTSRAVASSASAYAGLLLGSSANTNIQFSGGALAGPVVSSTSIGSINTASLANLFSEAAAENTGANAAVTAAASVAVSAAASVANTVANTVATTAATTATAAVAAGITSITAIATAVASGDSYLGITGPAFESVPTSQFGAGPTSVNLAALAQITAALNNKRDDIEERDDAVANALKQMRKKREVDVEVEVEERDDPVGKALRQMRKREVKDPVAMGLEEIRKREVRDPVDMGLEEIRKRELENEEIEEAIRKVKRDNIQNLLTTIFSSVARSNVLNDTIDYLVTDQRFENSVVLILRGVFANVGSTLTGVLSYDWSTLAPLVRSLFSSGLITDTITRALNDPTLGPALWKDISLLYKRDLALRDELLAAINGTDFTSLPVSEFITATVTSETTTVLASGEGTLTSFSSAVGENSTTPGVSIIHSAAGFTFGTNLYTSFFAILTILTMML